MSDLHQETLEMLNGMGIAVKINDNPLVFKNGLTGYRTIGIASSICTDHANLSIESAALDFVMSKRYALMLHPQSALFAVIPIGGCYGDFAFDHPTKIAAIHAFVKRYAVPKPTCDQVLDTVAKIEREGNEERAKDANDAAMDPTGFAADLADRVEELKETVRELGERMSRMERETANILHVCKSTDYAFTVWCGDEPSGPGGAIPASRKQETFYGGPGGGQ